MRHPATAMQVVICRGDHLVSGMVDDNLAKPKIEAKDIS
jgi:hypothetical protein